MPSRPPAPTVVAALQMHSGRDVQKNLDRAISLLRAARERGATLAGLPENFSHMGHEREKLALAESVTGPTLSRIREVARALSLVVLAGTIPEHSEDAGRVHASSALIGADGEILGVYRKIHLFDVELESGESYQESAYIRPGAQVTTLEAGGLQNGLSVCYDLRFPELYRQLGIQGAELFWVPSAFTLHTGKDHWEVLLRARAIENLSFVAAPAQFGHHGEKRVTYGNAMVVDPWGTVLARASNGPDTMAISVIDTARLERLRAELPTPSHHVL